MSLKLPGGGICPFRTRRGHFGTLWCILSRTRRYVQYKCGGQTSFMDSA